MGSIVAEIADKIASAGGGERSELEVRGGTGADGGGILTLSTSELTVVDGDKLGRIDFQAPLETGADALLVGASIYAEADDTFAADNNSTELVFAVGASEAAAEKMRLTHDGELGIGVATPASLLHVAGTVQVGVDDTGHDVIFYGDAAGALAMWDTSENALFVRGASADAVGSSGRIVLQTNQPAVADGDIIGRIDWNAPAEHATDGNEVAASIWAEADDTFAADNNSAELVFATGASEIAVEKMRLTHDGELGIGVATPASLLHVAGTVQVGVDDTGHDVKFFGDTAGSYAFWDTSADTWFVEAGVISGQTTGDFSMQSSAPATVGNCTYAFKDDSNTGMMRPGADQLALVTAGVNRLMIDDSGRIGVNYATPDTAVAISGSTRGFMAHIMFPVDNADGLLYLEHHHGNQTNAMLYLNAEGRSSSSAFEFIRCSTDGDNDLQFYVRGDGYVASDGGADHAGADYAEFFEWADGNLSSEDRTGFSVVFDDTTSNQIRKATTSDDASSVIGIVSAMPAVTGDSDMDVKYVHRFQKDDYNRWITEEYTLTQWTDSDGEHVDYHTDRIPDDVTVPDDAVVITDEADGSKFTRKIENDDYDASNTYTPRSKRKEWDTIGLMGKLRMKKGQPTGDRWIKMRAISSSVEEWLVR